MSDIQADISELVRKLNSLGAIMAKDRQRVAALGGASMAASIEAAAPRGRKVHKRYSTPKVNRRLRAPKGSGVVVATYNPGNLGNSIQVLKFARAKTKVYVGAKVARNARGNYPRGTISDGYYLAMVEFGTKNTSARPFFRAAAERSKTRVLNIMAAQYRKIAQDFAQKNAIR